MSNFTLMQEMTFFFQECHDFFIDFVHVIAGKKFHKIPVIAVVVYIIQRTQAVFPAYHEVIHTVIRRGVNAACSRFDSHVFTQQNRDLFVVKRMLQREFFQHLSFKLHQYLWRLQTGAFADCSKQWLRQQ